MEPFPIGQYLELPQDQIGNGITRLRSPLLVGESVQMDLPDRPKMWNGEDGYPFILDWEDSVGNREQLTFVRYENGEGPTVVVTARHRAVRRWDEVLDKRIWRLVKMSFKSFLSGLVVRK